MVKIKHLDTWESTSKYDKINLQKITNIIQKKCLSYNNNTANILENQLPAELKFAFNELQTLKHFRKVGIFKVTGFSYVYILRMIFCLVFENRMWFKLFTCKQVKLS